MVKERSKMTSDVVTFDSFDKWFCLHFCVGVLETLTIHSPWLAKQFAQRHPEEIRVGIFWRITHVKLSQDCYHRILVFMIKMCLLFPK